MPIRHTTLVLILSLCTVGCDGFRDRFASDSPGRPRDAQETPQQQIDKLRHQVETLQREKTLLADKLTVIEPRQRQLEDQLREMKFANERQAEQIRSLAPAPVQRDRYKQIAESFAIKVSKLRQENLELKARLLERKSPSTTRPAAPH
jgi:chromosome segregation ATPase